MATTCPPLLQRLRDAQLIRRRNAADNDAVTIEHGPQHRFIVWNVFSFDRETALRPESYLSGNRARCLRMISGDHCHADAGAAASGDRIGHPRSG
jgi:hypothetical protein